MDHTTETAAAQAAATARARALPPDAPTAEPGPCRCAATCGSAAPCARRWTFAAPGRAAE